MGGYYLDSLKDLDPVVFPAAIGARAIRIDPGELEEGEKGRRENLSLLKKFEFSHKIHTNSHITNCTHPCAVLCAILRMLCSQKRT